MRSLVVLLAAVAILPAACGSTPAAPPGSATTTASVPASEGDLQVRDGDVVTVHYVGTLDDGTRFDSSRDRGRPLTFTVGAGQVIAGFDAAVRGLRVGGVTTVRIPPAEAYGERRDDLVVEVPYVPSQGEVQPGDRVTLTNGASAIALEVREDTVVLDANHPLAGQALTFEIEVLSIERP